MNNADRMRMYKMTPEEMNARIKEGSAYLDVVVKGHWINGYVKHLTTGEERDARECSECGNRYFRYDNSPDTTGMVPNFCPNCGADLREGDAE